MEARSQVDIFKVLKEKNCQPGILYQIKVFFKSEGKIKTFPGKPKLREFVATRLALEEMLKEVLQVQMKVH